MTFGLVSVVVLMALAALPCLVLAVSLHRRLRHLQAASPFRERDHHQAGDLLARVLETMREGVLVLDGGGQVVLVNSALREMLLFDREIVGKHWREAVRLPPLEAALAGTARGELVSEEVYIGDLKPRRLLVNAAPLSGAPGALVAVFVDVTEMRRLETVRRDFVANVSHELRTPVAAIVAAIETLRGPAVRDVSTASAFLDLIDRNVQRLHRLLEDLLDLSRIESHDFHLNKEPLNLDSLVQHVLSLFDQRAAAKSIRLDRDIPELVGMVNADRRALEQVLTNLVENAIKYCPDGTSVTVRALVDGPSVRLQVEDTGPGIEARHLPRLFERFYRVDAGRSRAIGGTGLGLSIVKNLVDAMGSTITVESAVGQGTTFSITLQRA